MTQLEDLYKRLLDTLESECGSRCMDDREDREATAKAVLRAIRDAAFFARYGCGPGPLAPCPDHPHGYRTVDGSLGDGPLPDYDPSDPYGT